MKYYLYISDAKVDMLLPQISDETKKKVATELGFDLKILKASRKSEEESIDSRISRLGTVVEFLRKYGKVGTIDEPDDFIDDTQLMWSGAGRGNTLAYYAGRTNRTLFGFAGSAMHLIGASPTEHVWQMGSALFSIVDWLKKQDGGDADRPQAQTEDRRIANMVCAMADQAEQDQLRAQPLEVFAKRLLFARNHYSRHEPLKEMQVVLGTPLYIAMTD